MKQIVIYKYTLHNKKEQAIGTENLGNLQGIMFNKKKANLKGNNNVWFHSYIFWNDKNFFNEQISEW